VETGQAASTDIELMLRARDGDLAAFGKIVSEHRNRVMNFLLRCGVYSDVEDLAQEVFIKLWNARARYTPNAKFTTFLYTVARRAMIDRMRSGARRAAFHEKFAREQENAEPQTPKYCLEEEVGKALSCLSPEQRETVVLVLMQGIQYNEAAEILGIPAGTVKSRVSVSLIKMRREMEK